MSTRAVTPARLAARLGLVVSRYKTHDTPDLQVSARQLSLACRFQASELSNALKRFLRGESENFSIAKWAAIGEVAGCDEGWWFADHPASRQIDDSRERRLRIRELASAEDRASKHRDRRESSVPPPYEGPISAPALRNGSRRRHMGPRSVG